MVLPDYLADVADEMARKSAAIRRDFSQHRPSAGENREDIVAKFLRGHLPSRFGVSTGMIISHDGKFSNQADLVVVDDQNNSPLYPESSNRLWPVESVYALIEVKTRLNPGDLADAVSKGRRFKSLQRQFCEVSGPLQTQRIEDSLFVIWAFESPSPKTLKAKLIEILSDVPVTEQPDLMVVPDSLVVRSGSYLNISKLGQRNSKHRRALESQYPSGLPSLLTEPVKMDDCGKNSLLVWYVWFDSWLRQAGARLTDPISYLPPGQTFGKRV